jgi:hypothetical protein
MLLDQNLRLGGIGVSAGVFVVGGGAVAEADERHGDDADDPGQEDQATAPIQNRARACLVDLRCRIW